jgi:hypothetical protein
MHQNNLSLSSQNFVVDFLRFNLQFIDKYEIQEVAEYLSKEYSRNSIVIDQKKTYSLIEKGRFSCKAKFLTSHTKHWIGTRLEFEGGHASKFYQMIKENPLNWKRMDLDNTNLGRIDLYYDRKLKESDRVEYFEAFLSDAAETISLDSRSLVVDLKSEALGIGHRKTSPNFFRIYKKSNGKFIRFELEMKLETAKKFQFFLFAGQFETLESKLIQHYYSYITTKFQIQRSCYTDWLVENFRNIRVLQIPKNSLVTTYLMNRLDNRLTDQEFIYKLFQLLSYIRQLDYSFGFIVDQEYLIISFKFTDFLEFIGANKNHYQVQKVGKFLKYLQTLPPMLSTISNICFQTVNIFPYIKVFKKKSWYVQLAIAEELYLYNYPFHFPKAFLNYQNKYQFQARLSFLLAFSVLAIEKVFDVEEFLDQFYISNSNLRKVRSYLLQTFVLAEDFKLIKNEFVLVLKTNKVKTVSKLTTNLISRTKSIHFKELTK